MVIWLYGYMVQEQGEKLLQRMTKYTVIDGNNNYRCMVEDQRIMSKLELDYCYHKEHYTDAIQEQISESVDDLDSIPKLLKQ